VEKQNVELELSIYFGVSRCALRIITLEHVVAMSWPVEGFGHGMPKVFGMEWFFGDGF
jgi:hypothetical protein